MHLQVLEEHGTLVLAQRVEVALHQIGIAGVALAPGLAERVGVQVVVLNVPRLPQRARKVSKRRSARRVGDRMVRGSLRKPSVPGHL